MKILWIESLQHYGAQRAAEAAPALGLAVTCLGVANLRFVVDANNAQVLGPDGADVIAAHDAVVIRSFAPYISEVLTLAKLFKAAGKPVFDPILTEEGYAMSKMHDYIMLAKAGLPVPRSEQTCDMQQAIKVAQDYGWPVVLKGVHGAQGKYVFLVHSAIELEALWQQHEPGWLMVQEYLDAKSDYRVLVIDGKVLPQLVERIPLPGDFRTNSEFNEEAIAHPSGAYPAMVEVAEKAAKLLGRGFSGVDIRICRGTPYILEANRRPGFKAFEQSTGYDVATHYLKALKGWLSSL